MDFQKPFAISKARTPWCADGPPNTWAIALRQTIHSDTGSRFGKQFQR